MNHVVKKHSSKHHRNSKRKKNRNGRPFRKTNFCRCGLCYILPGTSFFIALCFYYYVGNVDKSLSRYDVEGKSINSRVAKLPTGLPSRSAFIVINLARRKDRWSCVSKEFRKENVIIEKFVATDASVVYTKKNRQKNIMDLKKSHSYSDNISISINSRGLVEAHISF